MRIIVLSRKGFEATMPRLRDVPPSYRVAIISIFTEVEGGPTFIPEHLLPNTLRLDFHDIDEPFIVVAEPLHKGSYHGFSMQQAEQVIAFADTHVDADLVLIHCAAGISRSGAIGAFLADYYGVKDQLNIDNPYISPNRFVLKLLGMALEKKDVKMFGGSGEGL